MKSHYYIMNSDGSVRPVDLIAWGHYMETCDRTIRKTTIGEAEISTVFLGLDHSWQPNADLQIFETMIFGGKHDGDTWRYANIEQARLGHERAMDLVLSDLSIFAKIIILAQIHGSQFIKRSKKKVKEIYDQARVLRARFSRRS